jgi:hypothetical protein
MASIAGWRHAFSIIFDRGNNYSEFPAEAGIQKSGGMDPFF